MEDDNQINIFWHICTIGKWKEITSDQIDTIKSSGLIDKVNKIYLTVLGGDFDFDFETSKIEVKNKNDNIKLYESVCLNDMRNWCKINKSKILYIHSKGVSRKDKEYFFVWEWRKMMEYFLIENWKKCLDYLDEYDTLGCNISSCGFGNHYSGNFWWANSSYISGLPEIVIGEEDCGFWKCETWLMSNNPHAIEIYRDKETQHYYHKSPKDYRGNL